jgi:hypothetical protein
MSTAPIISPPPAVSTPGGVPPRRGLATAALVVGIVAALTGCVLVGALFGLVAIVLGIVALVLAGRRPAHYSGKGRAAIGICTGVVGVLVAGVVLRLVLPILVESILDRDSLLRIEKASAAYQKSHDQPAPDLQTLVDAGELKDLPKVAGRDALAGVYYVSGIRPSDPPEWIVAYVEAGTTEWKVVVVVFADGTLQGLTEADFKRRLAKFQQDFESTRGRAPLIVAPRMDK